MSVSVKLRTGKPFEVAVAPDTTVHQFRLLVQHHVGLLECPPLPLHEGTEVNDTDTMAQFMAGSRADPIPSFTIFLDAVVPGAPPVAPSPPTVTVLTGAQNVVWRADRPYKQVRHCFSGQLVSCGAVVLDDDTPDNLLLRGVERLGVLTQPAREQCDAPHMPDTEHPRELFASLALTEGREGCDECEAMAETAPLEEEEHLCEALPLSPVALPCTMTQTGAASSPSVLPPDAGPASLCAGTAVNTQEPAEACVPEDEVVTAGTVAVAGTRAATSSRQCTPTAQAVAAVSPSPCPSPTPDLPVLANGQSQSPRVPVEQVHPKFQYPGWLLPTLAASAIVVFILFSRWCKFPARISSPR